MDISRLFSAFFPRRLRFDSQKKENQITDRSFNIFEAIRKSPLNINTMYSIAMLPEERAISFGKKKTQPSQISMAMYSIAKLEDTDFLKLQNDKIFPQSSHAMYSIAEFG